VAEHLQIGPPGRALGPRRLQEPPLALTRRRPDVQAAEYALAAADAEVAAAVANRFPRLTLQAGAASPTVGAEALLSGWVTSLGVGLVAPLFTAGARAAEVRRAQAIVDEELAGYGAAVLGALQEVEDALARGRQQAALLAHLDAQVALAERAAELLRDQYLGAMGADYLDVLTAQSTAQALRRQQIAARAALLAIRVDLYRALAGGVEPAAGG